MTTAAWENTWRFKIGRNSLLRTAGNVTSETVRKERLIIRFFVQNHRATLQCYLCCFIHVDRIYKAESIASQITVPPVMEILASESQVAKTHFFFLGGEVHLHYFFNRNLCL